MMDDNDILHSLRSENNYKALAALYLHLPPIRRMVRYQGGSREEAEDIFQEALIILCRKAKEDGFVLSSGVYPYLYSICRFLWQDELKKKNRMPVHTMDTMPGDTAAADAVTTVEEEARFRIAEKIIAKLGDRCRELLLLFYHSRLALQDIAARMGYSSEQTAKNQKYKCLEGARNEYRRQQDQITNA